jgi:ribosome-associated toxin RatA of RatAB toxin-antitoxin module
MGWVRDIVSDERFKTAATVITLCLGFAVPGAGLGCASTNQSSGWADGDRPGKGIVPDTVPDPDVSQDGTVGKLREPTQESVPIAGTDLVRGRSTVVVQAPISVVRKTVLDYEEYAEFMPHYAASHVLGRTKGGGHQVYMKWVALHGAMKMWARFDMSSAQKKGDQETYRSTLKEGNVKAAKAIWRMSPVDEHRTKLTLEVFLQPRVPMPSSLLNDENMKGAQKGVTAMRDRCEDLAK